MLILSRRIDQSIIIGGDIRVTVVSINRGQVRLGVEARRDIPVHRDEIWQRILDELPKKQYRFYKSKED